SLARAKLDLDYTQILAPISGRISRRLVDPGNLVTADTTALATIVSTEPVFVGFKLDERTLSRLQRALSERKRPEDKLPMQVALADDKGFVHPGVLDFVDNRVDPETGTVQVRGTLSKPDRFLLPGMSAQVRLVLGPPRKATLVTDDAVRTELGKRYLLVVTD